MSQAVVRRVALVLCLLAGVAEAHDWPRPFRCPPGRFFRTPQQVISDHIAALATGNLDLVMCDYAENAEVVMPGTVLTGQDQIRVALGGFMSAFGGALPTFTSMTYGERIVLVTWQVFLPQFSVPDGADTFTIRAGMIHVQTVHATFAPPTTP
ncbi:MAG: nuclear transport factor 2 family protein [Archangium sp.]|nr:nuclear transport factor 2 family protein [Archangium sp.]